MSSQDEVRKASEQFYAALNSMLNGNVGPMSEVWSHDDAVTAMHPIGGRQTGWAAVQDSFEQVSRLAKGGKVALENQHLQVAGDVAYELGEEAGQMKLAGHPITINHRVTNVYRREGGAWKVTHHHTDISPEMVDVLSKL